MRAIPKPCPILAGEGDSYTAEFGLESKGLGCALMPRVYLLLLCFGVVIMDILYTWIYITVRGLIIEKYTVPFFKPIVNRK